MSKDFSQVAWACPLFVLGALAGAEAQVPTPAPARNPAAAPAVAEVGLPPLPATAVPGPAGRASVPNPPQAGAEGEKAATSAAGGVTLSSAIVSALNANPDLVSATERIRIADATLQRARAEFYPKLNLSEAYLGTNIAGLAFFLQVNQRRVSLSQNFNHPGFVSNFSTFVTLQQNLYSGGRRTAEQNAATEQQRASAYALAAARNDIVYRVAEAYYRILQARDLMESRIAAVNQIERHVALVRSRYDAGTAVRSDVLSVEVKLAEAKESLITATNQLELGWAILENVTGCSFPRQISGEVESAPWADRVDAVESAVAEALGRRPELSASLSQVRGATHQIGVAQAGKRANVDFIGNFSTFDINRNSGGNGAFVGLIASINLFDAHRTKSDVVKANARVRELQAQHKRLMMDIELEVRQAYLALKEAEGRLAVSGQAVEQADQSRREIEDRYNDQKATITQLIDAQVASTGARVRRANAAADVQIARAGLQRVLGRIEEVLGR